jgi:hypothetical protein
MTLLVEALAALGGCPIDSELRLVCDVLRLADDRETVALLDAAAAGDAEAFGRLVMLADEAAICPLTALDLRTAWAQTR